MTPVLKPRPKAGQGRWFFHNLPGMYQSLWLLVASLVGNLPCVGLLHILALVIGNTLAGAVNGSPNLVVALPLPLVLAILLVLRRAFGFCVRLINCVVLLDADIFVNGRTVRNWISQLSGTNV